MQILFLDCETTGLDPELHVPWEIAAWRAEHTESGELILREVVDFFVKLTPQQVEVATPIALEIGQFEQRYMASQAYLPGYAAAAVDKLCYDKPHLVGAVPGFDDRRVGDLLRRCGVTPRWHYHLIDVEALAVGFLQGRDGWFGDGWKSDDLSQKLGVNPENFPRHTALGDVEWCIAQYATIFNLEIVKG